MATVAASRMTAEQASAALRETEAALSRHAQTCATCRAAYQPGSLSGGFRIWRVCPETGAGYVRTHLALSHRLAYLAKRARRDAKKRQQQTEQE